MKKQVKKMVLAKETLHTLETLAHVVGADTAAFNDCLGTLVLCPSPPCPTGMYKSCAAE